MTASECGSPAFANEKNAQKRRMTGGGNNRVRLAAGAPKEAATRRAKYACMHALPVLATPKTQH